MKVAILAPASVVHTQRWVSSLAARGHELLLLSAHAPIDWCVPEGVSLNMLPFAGNRGYFLNAPAARRALERFAPDLVNSHYASGYGTLCTLCNYRPSLLSVWGSDVFDFPYQSKLAGQIVRCNLRRADCIASTSRVMAEQVRRLVPDIGSIEITPFGVDTDRFSPQPSSRHRATITIGTVKTLADKYGVDVLIAAFARLVADSDPSLDPLRGRLRLLLVGDGPLRAKLQAQVDESSLGDMVVFAGKVPHRDVPLWLNQLDVYVAASRFDSESFGVAVIEASSCGLPVVVSNAGGLPEVVRHGVTGLVVPRNDSAALHEALKRLVVDAALRAEMGAAGRALVQREYEWERCVDHMIDCYRRLLESRCAGSAARVRA